VVMLGENMLTHQRYTESVNHNARSRISHIGERLRLEGARWESGAAATINTNGNADVTLSTAEGVVWQMHRQTWGATATTEYYIMNHPDGVQVITNLFQLSQSPYNKDADGDAILDANNRFFNVELVGFQSSGASNNLNRLFLILSSGDYGKIADAQKDKDNFSITSVDSELLGGAFRIARLSLNVDTGEMTVVPKDTRGLPVGTAGGGSGGSAQSSLFADSDFQLYDNLDTTKIGQFQSSNITTATTRLYELPDANGPLLTSTNGAGTVGQAWYAGGEKPGVGYMADAAAGGGGGAQTNEANTWTALQTFDANILVGAGTLGSTPEGIIMAGGIGGANTIGTTHDDGIIAAAAGCGLGANFRRYAVLGVYDADPTYMKEAVIIGGRSLDATSLDRVLVGGFKDHNHGTVSDSVLLGDDVAVTNNTGVFVFNGSGNATLTPDKDNTAFFGVDIDTTTGIITAGTNVLDIVNGEYNGNPL